MGEEYDPTGRNAKSPGAKLDGGKPRASMVLGGFSEALKEVCRVGTYGAEKYTPNGWMEVPDGVQRYDDAMMRHWLEGDGTDEETGLLHRAQAVWNALAALELYLRRTTP